MCEIAQILIKDCQNFVEWYYQKEIIFLYSQHWQLPFQRKSFIGLVFACIEVSNLCLIQDSKKFNEAWGMDYMQVGRVGLLDTELPL